MQTLLKGELLLLIFSVAQRLCSLIPAAAEKAQQTLEANRGIFGPTACNVLPILFLILDRIQA